MDKRSVERERERFSINMWLARAGLQLFELSLKFHTLLLPSLDDESLWIVFA